MIETSKNTNAEKRKVLIDNLLAIVQYCENKIDCRHAQQTHYFEERDFDSAQCKENPDTACDNCMVKEQVCSGILIFFLSYHLSFLKRCII